MVNIINVLDRIHIASDDASPALSACDSIYLYPRELPVIWMDKYTMFVQRCLSVK